MTLHEGYVRRRANMSRMKAPAYHATRAGDTATSPANYTCKFCGKGGLFWAADGAARRLYATPGELHTCEQFKVMRRSTRGHVDLDIPLKYYEDHRK